MVDFFLIVTYNLFFMILLIMWVYLTKINPNYLTDLRERLSRIDSRWFFLVTFFIILGILIYQLIYGVHNTDVDDAISSAAIAYLSGHNPYADAVTRHYLPSGAEIYSYYHYFPLDLLVHAFIYMTIGRFFVMNFPTYWFVVGYLVMIPPTAWAFHRLVKLPVARSLSLYAVLVLPFLWSNALLTMMGFIWGLYFMEERQQRALGIITWIFAASSKYITGVFVFFYFVSEFKELVKNIRASRLEFQERIHLIGKMLAPYVIGGLLFLLLWIPFGIWEVFRGVFLYQGSISERTEVAEIKGPLLVELLKALGILPLYMPFFLFLVVIFIVMMMIFYQNRPLQQSIVMSLILMMIFPFFGTELFSAPAVAMLVHLFRPLSESGNGDLPGN